MDAYARQAFIRAFAEELPLLQLHFTPKGATLDVGYTITHDALFSDGYASRAFRLFQEVADELAGVGITHTIWCGRRDDDIPTLTR